MAERKSKTEQILEAGKILEAWPFKDGAWALSVTPAPGIDKVTFSFFRKRSGGKGFNIYVDGIRFYNLIMELKKKERVEWEYKTGEKGSKNLSLKPGEKTYMACHGYDGKENATVGLTKDMIADMITLYDLFFKDLYQNKWYEAFERGRNNPGRSNIQLTEEDTEYVEREETPIANIPDIYEMYSDTELKKEGSYDCIMVNVKQLDNAVIPLYISPKQTTDDTYQKMVTRFKEQGKINFRCKAQLQESKGKRRLMFAGF